MVHEQLHVARLNCCHWTVHDDGLHDVAFIPHKQRQSFLDRLVGTTAAVLASKAEARVDRGQTWPQATKRRN